MIKSADNRFTTSHYTPTSQLYVSNRRIITPSFWNAAKAGEQSRLLSKLHSPAGSKASPILLGKLSSGLPTLGKSTSSHEGKLKIQPSLPRAVWTSAPNLKCGWKEKPLKIHVTVKRAMTSKVQASRGLDIAIIDLLQHPSLRKLLGLWNQKARASKHTDFFLSSKFKAEGRRLTSLPYFLPWRLHVVLGNWQNSISWLACVRHNGGFPSLGTSFKNDPGGLFKVSASD